MKRKEIMKTLSISGLALVIASSMLLSGCGNTENEKEVKTTTEASATKDTKDTKKDSKEIAKADEKVSNETQVASGETKTEEVKEDSKDKGTEEKSDKSDKSDKTGNSSSNGSTSSNSNSGSTGNSGSGNSGNSGNHSGNGGNTSNGGNSGNSGNTGSTSHTPTPAPSNGGGSSSTTPTHTHNWIPITQTIHHPAETKQVDQGHYETIVDQAAYDEEVPKMEYHTYCRTCMRNRGELVILEGGQQEVHDHITWHSTIGEYSVQTKSEDVQVGTEVIHHDAVTHQEWIPNIVTVVVKEAWDEVVTVGYQCSECGATK